MACAAWHFTAVRTYGWTPISLRITGRTNASNETNALTGLPGSMIIGIRSSPISPKPCGLPGCMATWAKSHSPSSGITALTMS